MLCCNKAIRIVIVILISNFNHLAKSRFTGAIIAGLVCLLLLGSQLAELTSGHEDCEDAICLCVSSPSDSDLDPIDDGYFSAVVASERKVVPQLFGSVTSHLTEHFKSIRAPPF